MTGSLPRIIVLVCWYDENPAWLGGLVASVAGLADHIVAVDGCYSLYPRAREFPVSPASQADAFVQACHGAGIGLTLYRPREPWRRNEVEKRDFMFRAGLLTAEPMQDWFIVLDTDEIVTEWPTDMKERLADTNFHVAESTVWERAQDPAQWDGTRNEIRFHRCIFRANPTIRIEGAHWKNVCWVDDQKWVLRGNGTLHNFAPACNLLDFRVEHRHNDRPHARNEDAKEFYRIRDMLGDEEYNFQLDGPVAPHFELEDAWQHKI